MDLNIKFTKNTPDDRNKNRSHYAYFENIKKVIVDELNKANKSILLAVAWLTDKDLFDILCKKASEGVFVKVLISEHETNINSDIDYDSLLLAGGRINFIPINEKLLHNKFCVIDLKTVLTGSYNWTFGAIHNEEDLSVVHNDFLLAEEYRSQFMKIRNHYCKDDALTITSKIKTGITDELFTKAFELIERDDLHSAIECFSQIIKIIPHSEGAIINRGTMRAKINDIDGAISDYSLALQYNPHAIDALISRAIVKLRFKNNGISALADLTRAIEIKPNDNNLYFHRATVNKILKRYENAFSDFEKALELNPDDDESKEGYSICKIDYFSELLNKDDENVYAINSIALELISLRRYEDAINEYLKSIKINSNQHDLHILYNNLGNAYKNISNFQKGIEYLSLSIKYKPDFTDAHVNLGYVYLHIQDTKKAIKCFEEAVNLNPYDYGALTELGTSKCVTEQYEEGILDLLKATSLNPKGVAVFNNLAIAYSKIEKFNDAIHNFSIAIENDNQASYCFYNRGLTYSKINMSKYANLDFNKSTELGNTHQGEFIYMFMSK